MAILAVACVVLVFTLGISGTNLFSPQGDAYMGSFSLLLFAGAILIALAIVSMLFGQKITDLINRQGTALHADAALIKGKLYHCFRVYDDYTISVHLYGEYRTVGFAHKVEGLSKNPPAGGEPFAYIEKDGDQHSTGYGSSFVLLVREQLINRNHTGRTDPTMSATNTSFAKSKLEIAST